MSVNTPATDESRPLDIKYSSRATANHGLMPALSVTVPGRLPHGLLVCCGPHWAKTVQKKPKKQCGLVGYCVGGDSV
jgi:hypothetical protein